MGLAEDVVSERLSTEARAATSGNGGQGSEKTQRRNALRRQIRNDIPVVLLLLRANNFPDGTMIDVVVDDEPDYSPSALIKEMASDVVKTLLERISGDEAADEGPKTKKFAAWSICVIDRDQSRVRMYLLSDGRVTIGCEPADLNDLGDRRLQAYATGLADLKHKLGG